jgi:hypothetical protein
VQQRDAGLVRQPLVLRIPVLAALSFRGPLDRQIDTMCRATQHRQGDQAARGEYHQVTHPDTPRPSHNSLPYTQAGVDAFSGQSEGAGVKPPGSIEREARERVAFYLALATTVIWFLLTFSLAVMLDVANSERPQHVIPLGFVTLAISALPWLLYRPLVRAWERRLRSRQAQRN